MQRVFAAAQGAQAAPHFALRTALTLFIWSKICTVNLGLYEQPVSASGKIPLLYGAHTAEKGDHDEPKYLEVSSGVSGVLSIVFRSPAFSAALMWLVGLCLGAETAYACTPLIPTMSPHLNVMILWPNGTY